MRIGVFGGTFDPIHNGHLALVDAALRHFGLDRVLLMPGHVTPFKQDSLVTSPEDRLAMVRLAARGNPRLEVSTLELDRGGVSYTVDTLEALRAQRPGDELWLLLGLDSLREFGRWRRARDILSLATVATLRRPGTTLPEGDLPGLDAADTALLRKNVADGDCPDISSSDIRRRIAAGLPLDGLLPEAVSAYIRRRGLYGCAPATP